MTRLVFRLRLIAALAVLLILAGLTPQAGSAQDAEPTPVAEAPQPNAEVIAPVVEAFAPPPEEPAPTEVVVPPPAEEPAPVETVPAPTEEPAPTPTTVPPTDEPTPTDTAPVDEPTPAEDPSTAASPDASPAPANRSARAAAESDDITVAEELDAETVSVSVVAFNCPTAPASPVPGVIPAGCSPAGGVKFDASVGDVSLGTFTTGADGVALVSARVDETLSIVEILSSVTAGYAALGSGTGSVDVAEGAALSLPHVATTAEPIPSDEVGRLQLTQGVCPTLDEARTELRYVAPQTLQAQAEDGSGCHGVGGAEFLVETVESEEPSAASADGIKRTDDDGNWRGELPVGSYTVTDVSSGQSIGVEVVLDGVSVVVAIDYVEQVAGSIGVRRFVCSGDADTTEITVSATEPVSGAGCDPEDGTFRLNDGAPFSGGGDGAVTFEVPIGTYQFSDVSDGGSTQIQIAEGATTWVLVERFATVGDISAAYNRCDDPASLSGDPNDASYWASACDNPVSGAQLGLINAAGETVAIAITDAAGVASWTDIRNGSYRILDWSADATCAVFVGQQAALAGFQISPGRVVQAQVFGCVKAAAGPGGGNSGGGDTGGDSSAAPDPATDNQVVTRLPSTGSSSLDATDGTLGPVMMVVIALALTALLASGVVGVGRRRG